jgi:hopanoid-associated phosphorylase
MILAATGLRREVRIITGDGVRAVAGGGRSETLAASLAAAASAAEAIISLGVGGALDPGLAPGDWVVASAVVWHGGKAATDVAWTEALRRRLPDARDGVILGSEVMLLDRVAKAKARIEFAATAVDMESHVAAQIAHRFGLPFAAARVISDRADEDLPAAVSVGLAADGRMALGPVLWAVAGAPGQIPALLRTARQAGRAFRRLAEGRRLLGPRLGRADLGQLPLDVR